MLVVACECNLSCVLNSFVFCFQSQSRVSTGRTCCALKCLARVHIWHCPLAARRMRWRGGTASVAVNKVNGYASDVTSVNSSTLLACFHRAFTCGTTASQHGGEALPAWHLGEQGELTRPRYNERCSTLPLPLRSTPRLTCASLARTFFCVARIRL